MIRLVAAIAILAATALVALAADIVGPTDVAYMRWLEQYQVPKAVLGMEAQ